MTESRYTEEAITWFLNEFHGVYRGLRLILSSCPVGGEAKFIGYAFDYDRRVTKNDIMSKSKLLAHCVARGLEVDGFLGG